LRTQDVTANEIHGKFKKTLITRVRQTHRLVLLRIIAVGILLFPLWILALAGSMIKVMRWRSVSGCRRFIKKKSLAFQNVDPSTLQVEEISGGLNNLSERWKLKTHSGSEVEYCVKVFLPLGSLWAKVNAMASPFPYVRANRLEERFMVDVIGRAELASRNMPVPKLIDFDVVEKIMVTEHLQGRVVDDVLRDIRARGYLESEDVRMIAECGRGLARIHAEGFSLIDTQPVNCIWIPLQNRIYFLDLEFCTRGDFCLWDVAFFQTSLLIRLSEDLAEEAKKIFIGSYLSERRVELPELEKLEKKLHRYTPVFLTILDLRQFTPGELLNELLR
jgi:tRNA A-37 threonylcarbamoyl transferase component Bud32